MSNNKEFVPYTEAFELKQIGFDKPCFGFHTEEYKTLIFELKQIGFDEPYFGFHTEEYKTLIKNSCKYPINLPTKPFLAPTFSQAFRFFREKYQLQGYVYSTTVRGTKEGGKIFSDYCWYINGIDAPFLQTDARDMKRVTYEEAELACLRKLIQIVKEEQ